MKAYVDLTIRKSNGEKIDSKNIDKHFKDIIHLCHLVNPNLSVWVNENIMNDIQEFITIAKNAPYPPSKLGYTFSFDDFISRISSMYKS